MARPAELNETLITAIAACLRGGMSEPQAAKSSGIHPDTLRRWKRRGEAGEEPYADLVEAMGRASGEAIGRVEKSLYAAAMPRFEQGESGEKVLKSHGDVRAQTFILERRDPETWGAQIRVKVEEEVRVQIEIAVTRLEAAFGHDPALLERIMTALMGEAPVLEAETADD